MVDRPFHIKSQILQDITVYARKNPVGVAAGLVSFASLLLYLAYRRSPPLSASSSSSSPLSFSFSNSSAFKRRLKYAPSPIFAAKAPPAAETKSLTEKERIDSFDRSGLKDYLAEIGSSLIGSLIIWTVVAE